MAAAIPAAIGVGSSIIGGIQGKGARKAQEKLAKQLLDFGMGKARELYPVAQDILGETYRRSAGEFDASNADYRSLLDDATGKSGQLFERGMGLLGESTPFLRGASQGIKDLNQFYGRFLTDKSPIDSFLPSAQRTRELLTPEFDEINRGYERAANTAATFAPRGGGRISALTKGDLDRQGSLGRAFAEGRRNLMGTNIQNAFNAASGTSNLIQMLRDLGLGTGQLGLGTIGAGTSLLGTGGGLAMGAKNNALNALQIGAGVGSKFGDLATSGLGFANAAGNRLAATSQASNSSEGLGAALTRLFGNDKVQGKITDIFGGLFGKKGSSTPGISPKSFQYGDFNYGYGGF